MIVDVQKYLIFGAANDLDSFFEKAQKSGFIEFISPNKKKVEMTASMQTLLSAIKILKKRSVNSAGEAPPISPVSVAERVVHANDVLEKLYEEERILDAEISRIAVFGDFSPEDIEYIQKDGKRYLQFFCMKTGRADQMALPPEMIYVGTDYDLDYFVSINKERKCYPGMIELFIEKPLGHLTARLRIVKEQISSFEHELRMYSVYMELLKEAFISEMNSYSLSVAKKEVFHPMGSAVFAVEAWIPNSKIKALHGMIGPLAICFEPIQMEKQDFKPTYMENKGVGLIGEDIIGIYDIPATTDKDPSRWVFWCFALFFAMIIADAGYGLIFLLLTLFLKWKFPRVSGFGKRFLKLMLTLSLFCIGWGIFTAAFFGIEIGPDNPYRKFSPLHYLAQRKAEYHMEQKDEAYQEWVHEYPQVAGASDGHDFLLKASHTENGEIKYDALNNFYDSILMELSLIVGMIHVILSFLRQIFRNWAGVGWILFIVGGYFYFPSVVHAPTLANVLGLIPEGTAHKWGEQLIYGGMGLAVVLALIQKRMGGISEIMNVIQIFADVLSYLRLYALALASMIMASTFNAMGMQVGLGIGFIIILLGHSINITLATMGGVIHGLRLNFLEWYHYCFEGGGRKFNPLRLLKR